MAIVSSILTGIFPNALPTVLLKLNVRESHKSCCVPGGRIITMKEVSFHNEADDCWTIIYDRVYDISNFLDEHPGGRDLLLEYAGGEASGAFRGSGHSAQAVRALERFCIGELPMQERFYRKPGGYKLSDLPE